MVIMTMLTYLSFCVFFTPPLTGERLSFSVTVLLTLVTADIVLARIRPVCNSLLWIDYLSILCISFCLLAGVENFIVLYCWYRGDQRFFARTYPRLISWLEDCAYALLSCCSFIGLAVRWSVAPTRRPSRIGVTHRAAQVRAWAAAWARGVRAVRSSQFPSRRWHLSRPPRAWAWIALRLSPRLFGDHIQSRHRALIKTAPWATSCGWSTPHRWRVQRPHGAAASCRWPSPRAPAPWSVAGHAHTRPMARRRARHTWPRPYRRPTTSSSWSPRAGEHRSPRRTSFAARAAAFRACGRAGPPRRGRTPS
mmetsp:Transcript_28201/g.76284  ORF Transcript_28201/g.76284 Transcript_28201/m.76284 type:complete len:308 (-) Transcript_28201:1817-2740(-)